MSEKPILFSAPMVRAILAGTKTQTRRLVKPQPSIELLADYAEIRATRGSDRTDAQMLSDCLLCPYGEPGTRLWVRETWMPDAPRNGEWSDTSFYGCGMSPLSDIPECYRKPWHCLYRATYEGCELVGWKPSIHMPRWASRITLEITDVRVERLQAISKADAMAEGVALHDDGKFTDYMSPTGYAGNAVSSYRSLWTSINGPGSWDANQYVWVVEFRRVKP